MPTAETSIWLALRARIQSAAGAMPVAWPGEVFETPVSGVPPMQQPYLAVGAVSAPPRRVLIGRGAHDRNGSVTLVYVAPLGNPAEWYLEKVGLIAAQFAEDTQMRHGDVCLRVTSRPHVADPYPDAGYLRTPIIIPWRCAA